MNSNENNDPAQVMFSRKERVKGGPPKASSSLSTMNMSVHVYVNGDLQPQVHLFFAPGLAVLFFFFLLPAAISKQVFAGVLLAAMWYRTELPMVVGDWSRKNVLVYSGIVTTVLTVYFTSYYSPRSKMLVTFFVPWHYHEGVHSHTRPPPPTLTLPLPLAPHPTSAQTEGAT